MYYSLLIYHFLPLCLFCNLVTYTPLLYVFIQSFLNFYYFLYISNSMCRVRCGWILCLLSTQSHWCTCPNMPFIIPTRKFFLCTQKSISSSPRTEVQHPKQWKFSLKIPKVQDKFKIVSTNVQDTIPLGFR